MKVLNCRDPHETPHATDHIAEIVDLIGKLMTRGLAYRAADYAIRAARGGELG